jgi:hypothetical protein
VNLLLTASTCIPYTVVSFPSDAKLLFLLARKGPVGERIIATLYLLVLDADGKEPREWPPELLRKLESGTQDSSRMPAALALMLAGAAETDDADRTAQLLERALAMNHKMLPALRRGFLAAACCYQGFQRNDADRAEEWLKRARLVKGGALDKDWDSKALAAISFAKGAYAESAERLTRYVTLLNRQLSGGMVIAERRRTTQLIDRLSAGTPVPS